ncbi:hypothetical protein LTR56_019383 [Elasticomyces elasticus]|nr:hypothetical protein LTR56_019383 [Elasticomyces elasticus]KAK3658625.1 hypothetical protein LTR22_008797 [Elasticomyces elasticus]KAK4911397.1 hypothetical protein LTR49_020048 [Elasticomyces elasticus]KAK5756562.1 hypothetical protein LTS12_013278 [Elasticomyces elasticus]
MQINTVQANTRAYDRTLWERMPLVLDASHRLHAVMGIPPGTQMRHTTEPRPQFENFENLSLPPELGGPGELPGVYVEESDHDDTDSDSADDAEYEEDNLTQNAGNTEPEVPTIRVQPPSAGRNEYGSSVPCNHSDRKRRPSDLPRPQLRQAHKRQKVEVDIIDLTSPVQGVFTEQLRAPSLRKHPDLKHKSKLEQVKRATAHPVHEGNNA